MKFEKKIFYTTALLILFTGNIHAKENINYHDRPYNVKPSKSTIDMVKKEQEALNNGAIKTFDNSTPGKWLYTVTSTSNGKSQTEEFEKCITKEEIEKNLYKNFSKMLLGEGSTLLCKSNFTQTSKTKGNFSSTCRTPDEEKEGSTAKQFSIEGDITSKEKENFMNITLNISYIKPDPTMKENSISIQIKNTGKFIGSCTTYKE